MRIRQGTLALRRRQHGRGHRLGERAEPLGVVGTGLEPRHDDRLPGASDRIGQRVERIGRRRGQGSATDGRGERSAGASGSVMAT